MCHTLKYEKNNEYTHIQCFLYVDFAVAAGYQQQLKVHVAEYNGPAPTAKKNPRGNTDI